MGKVRSQTGLVKGGTAASSPRAGRESLRKAKRDTIVHHIRTSRERDVASETLTVTDDRTGKTYKIPITNGTIKAMDLRQIKTGAEDFGLMTYDPAFMNTASTRSRITYIDGEKGILRYRGYPIEQLAEKSTYLESAYLVLFGELPTTQQLDGWVREITHHTIVHENLKHLMETFRYDAHPMGMLISTVAALSAFYPEASNILDPECAFIRSTV
jgi:citrate synthase